MQKYKIRYTWKVENRSTGYLPEDIQNEDQGLCDSIALFSIILPEEGGYSQMSMSTDGKTGKELSPDDLFKLFSMLGMQLEKQNLLTDWKAQVIKHHAETMRFIMKELKNEA